jgi:hypothetical protein
MNKILIVLGVLIVVGGGAFVLISSTTSTYEADEVEVSVVPDEPMEVEPGGGIGDGAEPLNELIAAEAGPVEIIGSSVEGRDITAYHFGTGEKEVMFIGGIHGGYSWTTALMAYELVEYLENTPSAVPAGVKVTVIPAVNPDGLFDVTGKEGLFAASDVASSEAVKVAGRFNANKVDLNRNFNCLWEETGTWQNQSVSGGTMPFSEPESQAVRDYVELHNPQAVVAYYAAAGGVYASNCQNGVMAETLDLTNTYANASGYAAYEEFDFYEITGDMVNWLAAKQIPAISVLLTTHEDTEWDKNLKGVTAVISSIAN